MIPLIKSDGLFMSRFARNREEERPTANAPAVKGVAGHGVATKNQDAALHFRGGVHLSKEKEGSLALAAGGMRRVRDARKPCLRPPRHSENQSVAQ